MRNRFGILSFVVPVLVFLSSYVFSQQAIDSIPRLSLSKVAQVNQTDSYFSFPGDLGNLDPLIFEANVNPNFVIRKREDSRIMLVLTPQILIRMYDEYSFPVRTPSYIPQLTFYYLNGSPQSLSHTTFFAKLAHHSNGQDGDFYMELEDGSQQINLKTGNFATNFIELGVITTSYGSKKNAVKFFKSAVEMHPKKWMLNDLRGKYSGLKWHNSFIAYKLPLAFGGSNRKSRFSIKAETSWMFDSINDWEVFDIKRWNGMLTMYYHPNFLEDIGFFIRFYHGMDYYNIYFDHRISYIQFGLMTEILRF